MSKPSLHRLWNAFPDHVRYRRLIDLYTMMGGVAERNINVDGFGPDGNTCASRLSHAFNHGGAPISEATSRVVRAKTIGTADGKRVIFRVADFRRYLLQVLGKPTIDRATPYDDLFRSRQGIIAFTVQGWGDATGHIALVRNGQYREPAHDNYATLNQGGARTILGEFWELP
jgi:hypothetical protein